MDTLSRRSDLPALLSTGFSPGGFSLRVEILILTSNHRCGARLRHLGSCRVRLRAPLQQVFEGAFGIGRRTFWNPRGHNQRLMAIFVAGEKTRLSSAW